MQNFTHFEFQEQTKNEKKINKLQNPAEETSKSISPSKRSIDLILNYSKALSIKKSKYVQHIEIINN
ncbi:MAG: hypothetical protein IT232_00925 [Flavobacteriales bacterium]|nr:hypothetical protein [Flavobacteriales bacterium]